MLQRAFLAICELDDQFPRLAVVAAIVIGRAPGIARAVAVAVPSAGAVRRLVLGLAVPFRIVEMVVRLHEVVDREIVLAVIEARPAADDLLELDHRVDRPHQDDIADVAGVHSGRELLRRSQDRRDGLVVVLEVPEVLVAQLAVHGGDPKVSSRRPESARLQNRYNRSRYGLNEQVVSDPP